MLIQPPPGSGLTSSALRLMRDIEADPLHIPSYHRLSDLYQGAGDLRKAELALRQAIEIAPLREDSWSLLGSLYYRVGNWRNSADAFRQACVYDADNADNWFRYGMAMLGMQDTRGATRVAKLLRERFETLCGTHLILGHLNKIHGLAHEAGASYRRALEIDESQTEALFNLVDLGQVALSDPVTRRLEHLATDSNLLPQQLANVRFALAKLYDRANLIDRAFSEYQAANAAAAVWLRATGNGYDPSEQEQVVDYLLAMFPTDVVPEVIEPIDLDLKIIFIVGLPRSGTTLVERILASHSQVCSAGEFPFMHECLSRLRSSRVSGRVQGPVTRSNPSDVLCLHQLREFYLDRLFERDLDCSYVVDKLPVNFSALGLIRILFPNALIVHCTRDPVATCWSLYCAHFSKHLGYYTTFDHLLHYYGKVYKRLMSHWAKCPGAQIIEVSYEALVSNLDVSARQLVSRCGLEWEDGCSRFNENPEAIYTSSLLQARLPVYTSSIDQWRRYETHLRPLIHGLRVLQVT